MTDQEIIDQLREGKRSVAFQRLYRYFPKVRAMVRQHGGNSDDAQDVFQEGLVILCRKITAPEFNLTSALETFLFGICRFVWMDEMKKRNKQSSLSLVEVRDEEVPQGEEEEAFSLAEQAFQQLGEKCKELLHLFYILKQSMSEIAERMGYGSEHSARNQKYKCIEHSREIYRTMRANHKGGEQ